MGTRLRSSLKAMVTREVLLRPFRRSKLVGGRKILRVTTKLCVLLQEACPKVQGNIWVPSNKLLGAPRTPVVAAATPRCGGGAPRLPSPPGASGGNADRG